MKFNSDDVKKVNEYLAGKLADFGFEVKSHPVFGYIKSASKYGVICLPGVCSSKEDGKQEYNYLCVSSGKTEPSDLGFYCEHEEDCVLSMYTSTEPIKVNIVNYRRFIDKFIDDINKTYEKYVKNIRGKVRITSKGDIFEGKEGIVESEKDGLLTVSVLFNESGKKIKQFYRRENVEYFKPNKAVKKEQDKKALINEDSEESIFKVSPIEDEKIFMLAKALGIEPDEILPYHEFYNENNQNYVQSNYYVVVEGEKEYLILNSKEAEERAKDSVLDYLSDSDSVGENEYYLSYIDEDRLNTLWEESVKDKFDYMSDYEIFEECVSFEILNEYDFEQDSKGYPDYEKPINELDRDNLQQELVEKKLNQHENGVEYFKEMMGSREFSGWVQEEKLIDFDELAEDIISNDGYGQWISNYNGEELYLGEDSSGTDLYAYRLN
jgi:hypothetical protein